MEIFGMVVVMAVTRIEPKISEHSEDDWLVHVGAQLVSDDQARLAANEVLRRAVVENLKELAGVSAQASRAVSAAAAAGEVAAQADGKAEDALEKWRQQKDELDKMQSAQIETNAKVNDAQQRAIDLGFLFNHGEWVISKEWKAKAGETKVMDFDTALSTPHGCERVVITTKGEPVGHGIKFLSPGFWRLYARVLIPWVGLVQSAEVKVSIVVMGKNGESIAKSKYCLVVDAAPGTASFPMTVEIPEAGCYAYVAVHTNRALNQSIVPGTFVEPGNNEFSAQQISKIF